MVTLTPQELKSLRNAKENAKKYHYGTLYNKRAREKYVALQHHLAKTHNCSVSEIQSAEKRK